MDEFRFSPRPNKASKIEWRSWDNEAFERAKSEKKLVLLAISGVWCHWCHVMDETSYSDDEIIDIINRRLIPIRIDTDQRPDINDRYNLGGWPTTAILDSNANLITGGTYIPPERLKHLLLKIDGIYREDPEGFSESVGRIVKKGINKPDRIIAGEEPYEDHRQPEGKNRIPSEASEGSAEKAGIYRDICNKILENLRYRYDSRHGGFGTEPKFPMAEALELAAREFFHSRSDIYREILIHSLTAMYEGGTYDHVEGGFFRYSTTADWSIPHYEKMLEDNAALLRLLYLSYSLTEEESLMEIAKKSLEYLQNVLYQSSSGLWSGTQDADEEYYSLDIKGRRERNAPYIDRTVYTGWNGMMVDALAAGFSATGDEKLLDLAEKSADAILSLLKIPGRGLAHYYKEGSAHLGGFLEDHALTGRAMLSLYEASGEERWIDASGEMAEFCIERLLVDDLFIDRVYDSAEGQYLEPLFDFEKNTKAARWLIDLGRSLEKSDFIDIGSRVLWLIRNVWRGYGLMASGYAMGISSLINPHVSVRISKEGIAAISNSKNREVNSPMTRALLSTYLPNRSIRWVNDEGLDTPAILICSGTKCHEPPESPEELKKILIAAALDRSSG